MTLTLVEAIDLSKVAADDMDLYDMPRFAEAIRLGIEALKRVDEGRKHGWAFARALLPGETKE